MLIPKQPDAPNIHEVERDGGDAAMLYEPTIGALLEEIEAIASESQNVIYLNREDSKATRYCLWDSQSPDGRKWAEFFDNKMPAPFDGACDNRLRLVDMITNEDVMLAVVAALRAQPRIVARGRQDAQFAQQMTALHRWTITEQLGIDYITQLVLFANYHYGDSPGVSFMKIAYEYETELDMTTLTLDDMMNLYINSALEDLQAAIEAGEIEADPDAVAAEIQMAAAEFQSALATSEYDTTELENSLREFFPWVKPFRARKIIKALRETGRARFPRPTVRKDGVGIKALRLFEDVFVRYSITDFQKCPIWYESEWVTEVELRERQTSQDYSPDFVDTVLAHETEAAFPEWVQYTQSGIDTYQEVPGDTYRGLYNLVHAYYMAVNEDGIPGRYVTTLHKSAPEITANGRQLIDYHHGKWPGHLAAREMISKRPMDSRGIPDVSGVNQWIAKLFFDTGGDNAQIGGVPPIISRNRRDEGDLYIAPLQEIPVKREGTVGYMDSPQFPRQLNEMYDRLMDLTNQYHGRPAEGMPPELVKLHREYKIMIFLAHMREIHKQILQLNQQYIREDTLTAITDQAGRPVIPDRESIQGSFDLQLTFNPDDLDTEKLQLEAQMIRDVLMAIDSEKVIMTSAVVNNFFRRLNPALADVALIPEEDASRREYDDEVGNLVKIIAGIRPEMVDDGTQNYRLRREVYSREIQSNPAILENMAENSTQILEERLKHLDHMITQYGENVDVGRTGVKPADLSVGEG